MLYNSRLFKQIEEDCELLLLCWSYSPLLRCPGRTCNRCIQSKRRIVQFFHLGVLALFKSLLISSLHSPSLKLLSLFSSLQMDCEVHHYQGISLLSSIVYYFTSLSIHYIYIPTLLAASDFSVRKGKKLFLLFSFSFCWNLNAVCTNPTKGAALRRMVKSTTTMTMKVQMLKFSQQMEEEEEHSQSRTEKKNSQLWLTR